MPILRNIPLSLNMEQILRRQGIRNQSKVRAQTIQLLHELLDSASELHLLEPSIAYELYPVTKVSADRLCLENGVVLSGPLLPSILSSAKELAVAVCTIGAKLEETVADLFEKSKPVHALLLDGIGSAAVDCLTQETCQLIRQVSAQGYQVSSPLTPGMHGLPLSEQWQLFKLVSAEQIGVHLTSSAMMIPRKSASMVIGIGPDMPTWTQAQVCSRCNMNKTCLYKVTSV